MLYGTNASHEAETAHGYAGSLLNDPNKFSDAYERGLSGPPSQAPGGIPAGPPSSGVLVTHQGAPALRRGPGESASTARVTLPGGAIKTTYRASPQQSRISIGERWSPISPFNPNGYGLSGFFDDVGKGIKRAFTPPRQIRQTVTQAGRVAMTTAVGAGTGFVASGFNPFGAVAGGTYGFAKGIYGVTSNAPQGRTLYQTAIPAAAIGAAAYVVPKIAGSTFVTSSGSRVGVASATSWSPALPGYGGKLALGTVPAGTSSVLPAAAPSAAVASFGSAAPTGVAAVAAKAGGALKVAASALGSAALRVGEQVGTVALLSQVGSRPTDSVSLDPYAPGVVSAPGYGVIQGDGGMTPGWIAPAVAVQDPGGYPLPQSGPGGVSAPEPVTLAGPTAPLMIVAAGVAVTWLLTRKK